MGESSRRGTRHENIAASMCTEDSLYVETLGAARSHVSYPRRLQRPRVRFPEIAHDVAVPVGLLPQHAARQATSALIMQMIPTQIVRTATSTELIVASGTFS